MNKSHLILRIRFITSEKVTSQKLLIPAKDKYLGSKGVVCVSLGCYLNISGILSVKFSRFPRSGVTRTTKQLIQKSSV